MIIATGGCLRKDSWCFKCCHCRFSEIRSCKKMININKKFFFPIDISSIARVGVSEWQNNYHIPITSIEYKSLIEQTNEIFQYHFQHLKEPREKDLLLCDYQFFICMVRHYHQISLRKKCEDDGCKFILESTNDLDLETKKDVFSIRNIAKHSLKLSIHCLLKNIYYGKKIHRNPAPLGRESDAWSIGTFSRLKRDYINKKNINCEHINANLIVKNLDVRNKLISVHLASAAERIVTDVYNIFQENFKIELDAKKIAKYWIQRLNDLNSIYVGCLNYRTPHILLVAQTSSPLHKVIALSFQEKGTKIVGFSHGNNLGHEWDNEIVCSFNDYSCYSHYILGSVMSARIAEERFKKCKLPLHRSINFESINTCFYQENYLKSLKHRAVHNKSIMCIGFPMTEIRYTNTRTGWFYYQLDVQLRILKDLTRMGFNVTYKIHPCTRDYIHLFRDYCSKVEVRPFEKTYHLADVLLFTHTDSTTFGYALSLNKPVVVLDYTHHNWTDEAYPLIKKRCDLVPARLNENDRIEYDKEILFQLVSNSKRQVNIEYLEKFMNVKLDDKNEKI